MEDITQPVTCKDYCYVGLSISGPEYFCDNATFSVPEIPGVTYTWNVNNSFFINTSANNNEFTLTRRRSGSALLTITVVVNAGECGTFTEKNQFSSESPSQHLPDPMMLISIL